MDFKLESEVERVEKEFVSINGKRQRREVFEASVEILKGLAINSKEERDLSAITQDHFGIPRSDWLAEWEARGVVERYIFSSKNDYGKTVMVGMIKPGYAYEGFMGALAEFELRGDMGGEEGRRERRRAYLLAELEGLEAGDPSLMEAGTQHLL